LLAQAEQFPSVRLPARRGERPDLFDKISPMHVEMGISGWLDDFQKYSAVGFRRQSE
jgi:hypothetical protein